MFIASGNVSCVYIRMLCEKVIFAFTTTTIRKTMLGMLVSGCFRNIGHLSVGQEGRLRGAMCYKLVETEEPQLKKQCMER